MKTYEYFQPEYVAKFQCDGSKCQAYCCCKQWAIIVDRKSYKKYSHIKPKNVAREITRNISLCKDSGNYQIVFDEKGNCPFLTDDKLCGIQKKYGEEFLSETCTNYPHLTYSFGDFFERSLTLTDPVVAEMVLLDKEPMKFETVEISEKLHSNLGRIKIYDKLLPQDLLKKVIPVQQTSIYILQERSLTLDQRLVMFGLYCDKLSELLINQRIVELEKINEAYTNSIFLQEQAKQFSAILEFNAPEHVKIMIGLLENLYGVNGRQTANDRIFLDALKDNLKIIPDENGMVNIGKITKNYIGLGDSRKKFLREVSTIFENYLVNEFFINCYPFRFYNTLVFNYGMFVTIYKILEFLAVAMSVNKNFTEKDLLSQIMWYTNNIDHNGGYVNKISEYLKGQDDIVKIMQNMLQV